MTGLHPATAFLRSGYFVETWGEVAETVMSESVLATFLEPFQKIPMVSTIDVGRAAAALLCNEWTWKRVVELAPAMWQRPLRTFSAAPWRRRWSRWSAVLLAEEGGLPRWVNALLGMYDGIANGRFVRQNASEHRCGTISLTTAIERVVGAAEPTGR